ncbi:MAG: hypothetical protein AB1480_11700 [Nitrospirota bacterium]
MDQIIFVVLGTVITVSYYILSPVKLSEKILGWLERLGRIDTSGVGGKAQKVRSYYVRKCK